MSSTQVGAVLRHIRKLATARKDHDLPDHQLLERFAGHRDEAAFAALLKRHGPMVLGVCRSVLQNLHDAEDAFQAAFLLLAQKAGSIHRREAMSGWLHRVAYHLAVRARATAARRRVLEKRAVTMPSADPVLDMSLREVRAVLFKELEGLPEEYRAPLVLCGLEEKSLEEASRLLGWTKWAVKGRLQRGRELLRARLRRRGLELPAALSATALALHSASGRVSAALADSTLRAAVKVAAGRAVVAGVVSAEVAALVQGASKSMFHGKAKIATALLLAVSVAATAFGVVRHRASAADPPAPQQSEAEKPKAQPKPDAEVTVELRGQVLDPDGKPVAGAKLYLAQSGPDGPAPSEQATSGPDGRFRFAVPRSEADKPPSQVMAVAEGHGYDWVTIGPPAEELTLRLVKDVPINGRILDPDGKPVVGAKLTVTAVSAPNSNDLGSYVEAIRKGYGYVFAKRWDGPLAGRPAVLTTGADGRFKLAGAGRERVVQLHLEGPAIASAYLDVMTRVGEAVASPGRHIHGASFDFVSTASRPIRGVVRDKDTGKPVAGVSVEQVEDRGHPPCKALTDKEGRYELLGLAKWGHYSLVVKPADGLYFQRRVFLDDTPGLGALTGDLEVVRGLTVRGRVTDKATGKPIAQARVEYHPLAGNPNVNGKVALRGYWAPRAEVTTGADGSYALTVLPGPGVIGVTGPKLDAYMPALVTHKELKDFFKGALDRREDKVSEDVLLAALGGNSTIFIYQDNYHALVLLEPGEKEEGLVKDVALERPHTVQVRVVGADGQPLTGVTVFGLVPEGVETLKAAEFSVRINPRRVNRQLVFYHKDKNLGFYLKELRGDTSGPLTIKLQPCGSASGRMVDKDGQPVAGLRFGLEGIALHGKGGYLAVTTDKEGRFRAEGLVPGQMYLTSPPRPGGICDNVLVEAGKHKDVGDIEAPLYK